MSENRTGAPFKRTYSGPLDMDSVKNSYEEAVEYAKSRRCYPGAMISVVEKDKVEVYKVNVDRTLTSISTTLVQTIKSIQPDPDSERRFMVIQHDLDCRPCIIVTETSEDGSEIINPSVEVLIEYLDPNTVKLSWNGELHGEVAISK